MEVTVEDDKGDNGLVLGAAAAVLAAGVGVAASAALANRQSKHPPDDAPGRTAKDKDFGGYEVVGHAVTINKSRHELYAFWRDFQNLAGFMENIDRIQPTGPDRLVWTIKAPAGQTVDVET